MTDEERKALHARVLEKEVVKFFHAWATDKGYDMRGSGVEYSGDADWQAYASLKTQGACEGWMGCWAAIMGIGAMGAQEQRAERQ